MNRKRPIGNCPSRTLQFERGFTLIELLIATAILLVGVVSVMQLIPSAIKLNLRNRQDTTSAVLAQRLRDLMEQQPIAASQTTIVDQSNSFNPAYCNPPSTGGGWSFLQTPLQIPSALLNGQQINFSRNPVPGYFFVYQDPNVPGRVAYEVRWNVEDILGNLGGPTNVTLAKRVVVGVRRAADPSYSVSFVSLLAR